MDGADSLTQRGHRLEGAGDATVARDRGERHIPKCAAPITLATVAETASESEAPRESKREAQSIGGHHLLCCVVGGFMVLPVQGS
jgi:hypothetical protein